MKKFLIAFAILFSQAATATIPYGLQEKQTHSLGESTAVPNQTVQFVANPDGSNIGSGGGVGNVNLSEIGGNPVDTGPGIADIGTLRTISASDDPAVTALQIMDDWDESDRAKVNPIVGQAGVDGGVGNASSKTLRTVPAGASSATVTSVADTASSTQLLAANANRRKYSVFNNSSEILYLKSGTTASLTDFTVAIPPMAQFGFYEDDLYTGRVDGIWANNSTGAALITEY